MSGQLGLIPDCRAPRKPRAPVGLTSRPTCSGLGKSVDARPGLTSRQGGSLTPFGHGGEPHTGNQLGPGKQTPRLSPLCTLLGGGKQAPTPCPRKRIDGASLITVPWASMHQQTAGFDHFLRSTSSNANLGSTAETSPATRPPPCVGGGLRHPPWEALDAPGDHGARLPSLARDSHPRGNAVGPCVTDIYPS